MTHYLPQDFARCPSNPILEQCKQCSRNVNNSPVSPTAMWQSWIGPWVGHGPCPNGDFVEKKAD
jgi:hypothetical protein